jgi:hypothetical protein
VVAGHGLAATTTPGQSGVPCFPHSTSLMMR